MPKKNFPITALILTFVGVFFIGVVIVAGILFFNEKTIVVPDDFPTIQQAVDAADPGDIILVKASGGPYGVLPTKRGYYTLSRFHPEESRILSVKQSLFHAHSLRVQSIP